MAVRRDHKRDKWLVDAYINGKRIRRWFESKSEANRFNNSIKQESSPLFKAIQIKKEQPQRLSELVHLWFDLHGQTLVSGKKRYQKLLWIAEMVGDPLARDFSAADFADFRAKRLNGEIVNKTNKRVPKEAFVNLEQAILRAMFNELKRLKKWKGDNPIAEVRKFKVKDKPLLFLRDDEIERLLVACDNSHNPYLSLIVRIFSIIIRRQNRGYPAIRCALDIFTGTTTIWNGVASLKGINLIKKPLKFIKET